MVSDKDLEEAIYVQSFQAKKAEFVKNGDKRRANFMKTGKKGQWQTILSTSQKQAFSSKLSEELKLLGYPE